MAVKTATMSHYRQGDSISYRGYDMVATATAARGGGSPNTQRVVVLNNNSSHYLVCHDENEEWGYFLQSFAYKTEEEVIVAYKKACDLMLLYAFSH